MVAAQNYADIDKAPEEKARGHRSLSTTDAEYAVKVRHPHADCPITDYVKNMISGSRHGIERYWLYQRRMVQCHVTKQSYIVGKAGSAIDGGISF